MCVDYRALNRITIKNRFPVPRVEDLFDKLQGSTYFSRIDLKSGYHQIRIVDEDIVKTAFRTTFGLYEYLTIEEHKEHLKVIFQALRDNKLYVNQKKSEFFLQKIQYLGHIISKNGIRMDPAKLEVIKDWPNPRNLHEVRSFIGMCAYYRRFIEKFSLIAGPLHDLTKKNVKYVWTEKRQQAFDTLKQKLISQPVLALPDLSKPFEVQCDACGDCLGAVLLQEGHAIAYESRRLSSDEQILGIYEKELLAVLHALDSWKHCLLGTPFFLRTDHQSLKYFMMQTKLSDKQMRWANFISRFNFHIAHIDGKHNQVTDALSRRPKVNAVSIATHNDLSSMIDEYAIDPNFKDVISAIALGKKEEPFTLQDGYLLHGNRLCITRSLREKVMFESHAPPYTALWHTACAAPAAVGDERSHGSLGYPQASLPCPLRSLHLHESLPTDVPACFSSCDTADADPDGAASIIEAFLANLQAGAVVPYTHAPTENAILTAGEEHAIDMNPAAILTADGVAGAPLEDKPAAAKIAYTSAEEDVANQYCLTATTHPADANFAEIDAYTRSATKLSAAEEFPDFAHHAVVQSTPALPLSGTDSPDAKPLSQPTPPFSLAELTLLATCAIAHHSSCHAADAVVNGDATIIAGFLERFLIALVQSSQARPVVDAANSACHSLAAEISALVQSTQAGLLAGTPSQANHAPTTIQTINLPPFIKRHQPSGRNSTGSALLSS
ncbi:hypothetical protein L7F22_066355 [Adiantum nelumboides]|nr:hypothetical protein [Adiantum nelumboides]